MSKSSKGNAEAVRAVVTSWRSIARRKIHDLSLLDAFGWHLKGTTMLDAIYLCIVSQFNLPEYESCLKRQPEQILLVVSDEMSTRIATERLYLKLQTALPNSKVFRSDKLFASGFKGTSMTSCQHWVKEHLTPFLQQRKPLQVWLNFTGGTKALVAALLEHYPWDRMEYRPEGSQELSSLARDINTRDWVEVSNEALADAPALVVAQLSSGREPIAPNPLATDANLPLAQLIHDSLAAQQQSLHHLFFIFSELWFSERYKRQKWLEVSWADLHLELPVSEIEPWLEAFQGLCPEALAWDEQLIRIAGKNHPRHKHWVRWICGDWLESLCASWLLAAGLPESQMVKNLELGQAKAGLPLKNGKSIPVRELDLFIHHQANTYLVEIKADLKINDTTSLERQLSSLGDRAGHSTKILYFGPEARIRLTLHEEARRAFFANCEFANVTICQTREELLTTLKLPWHQPVRNRNSG